MPLAEARARSPVRREKKAPAISAAVVRSPTGGARGDCLRADHIERSVKAGTKIPDCRMEGPLLHGTKIHYNGFYIYAGFRRYVRKLRKEKALRNGFGEDAASAVRCCLGAGGKRNRRLEFVMNIIPPRNRGRFPAGRQGMSCG